MIQEVQAVQEIHRIKIIPKSGGIGSVTIEKLADTVIIEKEADTDKVVSDMVAKFKSCYLI